MGEVISFGAAARRHAAKIQENPELLLPPSPDEAEFFTRPGSTRAVLVAVLRSARQASRQRERK